MRRLSVLVSALLCACSAPPPALEPLPSIADSAPSTDVVMIRPKGIVLADTPFFLTLNDRAVFDLRDGESTRFKVPAGRQVVGARCLGGVSTKPPESRLDHDFPPGGTAYFLVEAKNDCASLTPVDPKRGEQVAGTTRFRGVGTVSRTAMTSAVPGIAVGAPVAAGAVAAAPAATPVVPRSAKEQVAAATAVWADAYNQRDAARIASLYDPEAVLWGTNSQRMSVGPAAIAEHFKGAGRSGERVTLGEQQVRVYGDVAVDTGSYTFWASRDGKPVAVPARYTLVYRHRDDKWLIVEHHSSLVPAP